MFPHRYTIVYKTAYKEPPGMSPGASEICRETKIPGLLYYSSYPSVEITVCGLYGQIYTIKLEGLCIFLRSAYSYFMEFIISAEEKQVLLADARETIAARLEGRRPQYQREEALRQMIDAGKSVLAQPCGAFVTLHINGTGGKKLRGCIGRMSAAGSLEQTVRTMAGEAAFADPRFPPLEAEELDRCSIEISALSPMAVCNDPRSIKVGVHGLYLSHRGRSGVLLPQVPVEQGWNLDEFLDYICVKAGLPPQSYGEPGARLFTFTAEVFGE
ncbi:MAG: AmmeMemoRadiSam system protein A [Treponema sp.]|nr:AmmeMemoRadiSam system protein A [Treponema sp.]